MPVAVDRSRERPTGRSRGALLQVRSIEAVKAALFHFYWATQRILVPTLKNSQVAYRDTLAAYVGQNTTWLDLGCGHQLFPEWLPSAQQDQAAIVGQCKAIIGIDRDALSLQKHAGIEKKVHGDIHRLPFQDDSFDLVTANVVVEHVEYPAALLGEVHRVLKPGGFFLFHTPNLLGYATLLACLIPGPIKLKLAQFLQNRREEDVFPTHYRLNTPTAVKSLAERTGFQVATLRLVESSAQTVMLGPVVIIELLWIRLLRLEVLRNLRTNLIVVLQKVASDQKEASTENLGSRPEQEKPKVGV